MDNVQELIDEIPAADVPEGTPDAEPAETSEKKSDESSDESPEVPEEGTQGDDQNADTEPAPVPRGPALRDELFTDEALGTKEGILEAREALAHHFKEQRGKQRDFQKMWHRVERREKKLLRAVGLHKQDVEVQRLAIDRFRNDVGTLFAPGSKPEDILATLGRITKRDGADVFNAMAEALAGKAGPAPSKELEDLREEVRKLKEAPVAEAQVAEIRNFVEERKHELANQAFGASEEYPHVVHFLQDPKFNAKIVNQIVDFKVKALAGNLVLPNGKKWPKGIALDDEQAIGIMELELQAHPGASARVAKAAGTGSGEQTRASSPTPKIRTLTPSITDRSGARVEADDGESIESLAKDPNFLRSIGM